MNDDAHFRLTDPQGNIIARGPLDMLMERIPQSVARMRAEEAIQAAARAIQREADDKVRADALDRREAEIKAREDAILADQVRGFCDSVAAIGRRLDAFAQKRQDEELKKLPEPDFPTKDDYLPPAVLEPSADKDREQLMEVEGAISKDDELQIRHAEPDQDPGAIPATSVSLSAIMGKPFEGGRLPEGTPFPVKHDSGFVCKRDFKAWKRQQRQA
jgi:hypothetical protein